MGSARILGEWFGQLPDQLRCHTLAFAVLVTVVIIDSRQHCSRFTQSHMLRERSHIKEVPRLVSIHDEITLDAQGLIKGWNAQLLSRRQLNDGGFQWFASDQLPHACFDVAEFTKDDLVWYHPVGNPTVRGFDRLQNQIESFVEISEYVVVVKRNTMRSVKSSSGASYEDGVGHHFLESGC